MWSAATLELESRIHVFKDLGCCEHFIMYKKLSVRGIVFLLNKELHRQTKCFTFIDDLNLVISI